MKIKLVSDLHLEFSDITIRNGRKCDVLILGGDICIAETLHKNPLEVGNYPDIKPKMKMNTANHYRRFFDRCCSEFSSVIYIMGNHEFYRGRFFGSIDHMRQECARHNNLYMLENDTKIIDDVVFIGGTLWTDCNKGDPLTLIELPKRMNDFRLIRNDRSFGYSRLRPEDIAIRHRETLSYFKQTLAELKENGNQRKVVVVSHHAPSTLSVSTKYKGMHVINGGYTSDLSEFIMDHPEISLWTHGHMHTPSDYMIGITRIVCNPRGYESTGEKSGWNPNIVLKV